MKTLLIITGPQGSGNHLWSKIISETPGVQGWTQLTQEYWVGHGNEPFSDVWEDPTLFERLDWPHNYYMTSISCPYVNKGGPTNEQAGGWQIPKFDEFITAAQTAGFTVKLAVIGRDFNILAHQQQRIRQEVTTPRFLNIYDEVLTNYNPLFISTELLYLYRHRYIEQVSKLLDFPISIEEADLESILKDNSNSKYIRPIINYWLDDYMREIAPNNGNPLNPYKYNKRG